MTEAEIQPWYKQFWPWFLIVLPGTVVVASLYTVYIAFTNQDSMVESDYYKQGLAINQTFSDIEKAAELGIRAKLIYSGKDIIAELESNDNTLPDVLHLAIYHPFSKDKDISLELLKVDGQQPASRVIYKAEVAEIEYGRYHLELFSEGDTPWKIKKEVVYPLEELVMGGRNGPG